MAQQTEPVVAARTMRSRLVLPMAAFLAAIAAAGLIPVLDRAVNPGATEPGLVTYLGVGLSILALTAALLYAGLVGNLPRTAVFTGSVLGYSALLVLVKFGLAPLAVYGVSSKQGLVFLGTDNSGLGYIVFPVLTAVTAMLYSLAFLALTLFFRSRLRRRLGIPLWMQQRFVVLMAVMFALGLVGGLTGFGALGFLEYGYALLAIGGIAVVIAIALLGALALCAAAFREAESQAMLVRDVTLFTGFAWVGLAFIAAYHVVWLVFILAIISIWPVKSLPLK